MKESNTIIKFYVPGPSQPRPEPALPIFAAGLRGDLPIENQINTTPETGTQHQHNPIVRSWLGAHVDGDSSKPISKFRGHVDEERGRPPLPPFFRSGGHVDEKLGGSPLCPLF